MKRYEREKGWRRVNVKLKKNIKNNYKKMERKKIMMWTLTWGGWKKKKMKIGERGVCFV